MDVFCILLKVKCRFNFAFRMIGLSNLKCCTARFLFAPKRGRKIEIESWHLRRRFRANSASAWFAAERTSYDAVWLLRAQAAGVSLFSNGSWAFQASRYNVRLWLGWGEGAWSDRLACRCAAVVGAHKSTSVSARNTHTRAFFVRFIVSGRLMKWEPGSCCPSMRINVRRVGQRKRR